MAGGDHQQRPAFEPGEDRNAVIDTLTRCWSAQRPAFEPGEDRNTAPNGDHTPAERSARLSSRARIATGG